MDNKNPVKDALELHREMYDRRRREAILYRGSSGKQDSAQEHRLPTKRKPPTPKDAAVASK